jgi:hypothetical protein
MKVRSDCLVEEGEFEEREVEHLGSQGSKLAGCARVLSFNIRASTVHSIVQLGRFRERVLITMD